MKKSAKQYKDHFGDAITSEGFAWFKENYPKTFKKLLEQERKRSPRTCKVRWETVYVYLFGKTNTCQGCGDETRWGREVGKFRKFCSTGCMANHEDTHNKKAKTNLDRYGSSNVFASDKVKKKIKKTIRKKYGVDNVSQNEKIKRKKIKTSLKNCGAEYAVQTKEGQARKRKTNLERYGVEHSTQCKEVIDKRVIQKFKKKQVVDVNGKKHSVLGFEHFAVDWLGERGAERIVTRPRNLPSISYTFEGKDRRYFPDIGTIRNGVKNLWEVKSSYTLRDQIDQNIAKFKAAIKFMKSKGYGAFYLMVFDRHGDCVLIKNPTSKRKVLQAIAHM